LLCLSFKSFNSFLAAAISSVVPTVTCTVSLSLFLDISFSICLLASFCLSSILLRISVLTSSFGLFCVLDISSAKASTVLSIISSAFGLTFSSTIILGSIFSCLK
jgi:hypothetical protein